jgi:2-oxo-3-hexenedioate decarboxylase
VAWFVRKLADRGEELPAGSLVLAGALTAAIPVTAGDVVRVTVDRIGSVELVCR